MIFDTCGTCSACLKHIPYTSYAKVRQGVLFLLLLWHVLNQHRQLILFWKYSLLNLRETVILKTKKAKGFYLKIGAHNGVTDFCGICIISDNLASLVMYPWASCLKKKSCATESSSFYISLCLLSGTPFIALFHLSRARKGGKVHPAQFGNTKKLPSNSAFVWHVGFFILRSKTLQPNKDRRNYCVPSKRGNFPILEWWRSSFW